jgi:cytochrome b
MSSALSGFRERAAPVDSTERGDPVSSPHLTATPDSIHVWDWPLRVCHWLLVLTVAGAWATHYAGIEWFPWHRRLGYASFVLVGFRVTWGFVGPHHARFRTFVRGPRTIVEYLRKSHSASDVSRAGHNPLGALSVLALLAVLAVQAATGLFANDAIANTGPFYGWAGQQGSDRSTAIHAWNSWLLLGLIAMHLLAVAWHDLVRKRGLSRAMLTGRQPARTPDPSVAERPRSWLALAIVTVFAIALACAIRAAPEATLSLF